jgi:hypothetical protein
MGEEMFIALSCRVEWPTAAGTIRRLSVTLPHVLNDIFNGLEIMFSQTLLMFCRIGEVVGAGEVKVPIYTCDGDNVGIVFVDLLEV